MHETIVLVAELPLLAQGLLPVLLQCRGDQPVLGIDRPIAAFGQPRVVAGPLQSLLPVRGQPLAVPLYVAASLEAQFQRGRFQGTEDLPGNQRVDDVRLQAVAGLLGGLDQMP